MSVELLQRNNRFQILALDHYGSIIGKLGQENLLSFKKDVLRVLGGRVSAVLLDQESGLPAYRQVDLAVPFILKADPVSERGGAEERPALAPEEARRLGASALKLLARHPDRQRDLVVRLAEGCQREGLPFILEIIPPPEALLGQLESVLAWQAPIDVFKLPYPGGESPCRQVTDLLGDTPWTLLSGGTDFASFKEELAVAQENGARGFLAGRALWQEALSVAPSERVSFLRKTALPRWEELTLTR